MSEQGGAPQSLEAGLVQVDELIGRRAWREARELAQTLVADYPTSPTAHAVLGDIAAAQHLYREAIEWYRLSLRLQPSSEVQTRLERAEQAVHYEREGGEEEAAPTGRDQRTVIIIAAAGFLVLALVVTLLAVSARHRKGTVAEPQAAGVTRPAARPGAPGATSPAAPVTAARPAYRPTTAPAPVGAQGQAVPAAPGPGGNVSVNQMITQSVSGPMSDADYLLTRALSGVTWPSGAALGADVQAAVDPFTGYALVTAQIPTSMPKTDLYPLTIDTAYRLAVTVVRADASVGSLTVRVLVTLPDEKDRAATLVAFRGNTNRETLDYYLKRNVQPDRDTIWQHVFATTWWNPSVPAQQQQEATQ